MKSINDIVKKVDIVNIVSSFTTLNKSGTSFKTMCNVHLDSSPSLFVNPKKQIYKCFVCDHGGDALDYLMWSQKFDWNQAIEFLIKASGEEVENYRHFFHNKREYSELEKKLLKASSDASDLFNYFLNIFIEEDNDILEFIKKRKLTKEQINQFKLGYAPSLEEKNYIEQLEKKSNEKSVLINASLLNENGTRPFFNKRLVFPIFDEENNVVAFSGRKVLENIEAPKYINSKESLIFKKSSIIYNYNNAKKYEDLIIVEGFMDVISFSKIGFNNVVALMGTSLSSEIIKKLKNHKEILIFLDNDQAGIKATLSIVKEFLKNGINAFILENKYSKDADQIINEENGQQKILNILSSKIKMVDYIIWCFFKDVSKNDYENIKKSIIELSYFVKTNDQFIKLEIIDKLSQKLEIDKKLITSYFDLNLVKFKQIENEVNVVNDSLSKKRFDNSLNTVKLLISIWKNPSFIGLLNIDDIYWPEAKYKKIYKDIKNYFESKQNLSKETIIFLENNQKKFSSKESLAQNKASFNELVLRTKEESNQRKLLDINNLMKKTSNDVQRKELLKTKLDLLSKRMDKK